MRSPVRLAAMMPARRATSRTSPLACPRSRMRVRVAGAMRTRPLARASRSVSGLALVSTMRLAPCSSKWVRSVMRCVGDWWEGSQDFTGLPDFQFEIRAVEQHAEAVQHVAAEQDQAL